MEQSEISIIPGIDDDFTVFTVVKSPILAEGSKSEEATPVPVTYKVQELQENINTKTTSTATYVTMPGYNKPMKLCRIRNYPREIRNIKNIAITEKINQKCKYQVWKKHALTIFQNSYVYPFITSRTNYKCFVCPTRFFDTYLLKKHTIEEHTLQEISRKMDSRAREMCLKVDVADLMCSICSNTFTCFRDFKLHLKGHGKDIDPDYHDNLIPMDLGDEKFKCLICGEVCLKLRILVTHMSQHFSNYNCEICGAVFCKHYLLKRHLKIHTSESFPCQVCNKVFGNLANRSRHYRTVHLKLTEYRSCPICPEKFISDYRRTQHLRIVHNRTTGLFKCEICGKEYDLKDHLLSHVKRAHLKEKKHECSICHHRFFSKSLLTKHAAIHSGDDNYTCETCNISYIKKSTLIKHLKSHLNDQESAVCDEICVAD